MAELHPDYGERPAAGKFESQRRVVEHYDYQDETGAVLFRVVRTDPKGFYQRRPDPERPGKWLTGLGGGPENGGVRRVLYRLNKLAAAKPEVPVVIAEGERKVHALEDMGLLATCNVGGASGTEYGGLKWLDEYSAALAGRRVTVLPDNDEAGIRHAWAVAASLMRFGAASVRVVELPGLGHKEDVCDLVRRGLTREELIEAIKAVPEWRKT